VTFYFLDSSALLKRYIIETGSTWVTSLTLPGSGHSLVIAHITLAELVSGIMRRRREGTITVVDAQSIRVLIDHHAQQEYSVMGLTPQIVHHAEDLLEAHPLRAYDAVQLASALEIHQRILQAGSPPLIFVSADQRLLTVAIAEGLQTDDPNLHP
jgi:uncharacterized protein